MTSVVERFLRYVKIDTQSDPHSKDSPSTPGQLDLARLLVSELEQLGLQEVELDTNGFVTAKLPANTGIETPVLGLIAHMDTSPDCSGANVNPRIVDNYDGKDILLNPELNLVLSPDEFPELLQYLGQTLITTDGATLLGADDKAGIAEIMAALEILAANPSLPHGTLRVAFTPDEEIGHGAGLFDVKKFGADVAYTLDGGQIGEFNYESFNAAAARITVHGRSVHPGTAKGKMINALQVAIAFNNRLPEYERPEFTEGYEGFFHLTNLAGNVEEASLSYIIRDHDREKFEARKALIAKVAADLNGIYGPETVTVELADQYFNMREVLEPMKRVTGAAIIAMRAVGIEPQIIPIRGGTDGARFCYMGLPTPNIFAGGLNFHGRYEYIPVPSMEKAVEVVLKIVEMYAEMPR